MVTPEPRGPYDYGSVAEAAALLGCSKQTLVNWRRRYPDFPQPLVTLAMGPVWSLCAVRDWGRAHGKYSPGPAPAGRAPPPTA